MNQPEFRGFSKETNSWNYGFGWYQTDYTEDYMKKKGISQQAVLYTDTGTVACELESMGQFTGEELNGQKIYYGDVIRVDAMTFDTSSPLPECLNVGCYAGMFQLYRGKENLLGLHLAYIKAGEVVGTMYEHPELVKPIPRDL